MNAYPPRHIQVYEGVYLAKESFTEVAELHTALDGSVFKDLHQEVIITSLIVLFYSYYYDEY